MVTCEYCNKELSSQYALAIHQKTTKSCISLRKLKDSSLNDDIKQEFTCSFCKKEFTTNSNFQRHIVICKDKKSYEYESLNEKYKELYTEYEKLKQESSISKNYEQLYNNIYLDYEKTKQDLIAQKESFNNSIEIKTKLIKKEFEKQIAHLQEVKETQKETLIKYETTIQFLKDDIEKKSKDIDLLRHDYNVLMEKYSSVNKNIINNYSQVNNYNGIDYSQKNFDRIVDDKYTYQLFVEGKKGAQKFIIHFIRNDQNIKEVIVSDDARDKIKVIDTYGNTKTIDFDQLSHLCKESESLKSLITKYSDQFFKDAEGKQQNPLFPIQEEVLQKATLFKKKNLKSIYKDVKSFIKKGSVDILELKESIPIQESEEKTS